MAENVFDFIPPGGIQDSLIGQIITAAATVAPAKMVHHVTGTTAIVTITPPWTDFTGPVYLIADSVFSWTSAGNIAVANATTVVAKNAYGFLFDRVANKWYPFGQGL
jgi:hypothetical protein